MSNVLGIISEYNPFHNGHLYHLRESKKIKGKLGSFAVYSILKSEWIASQKNLY